MLLVGFDTGFAIAQPYSTNGKYNKQQKGLKTL